MVFVRENPIGIDDLGVPLFQQIYCKPSLAGVILRTFDKVHTYLLISLSFAFVT